MLFRSIECLLSLTEDFVNRFPCIQFFVDKFRIPLIGDGKLVFKVSKAVVDRRCGQHQYLGTDTCADHFIHQFYVTVLLGVGMGTGAVAEVVGLVNDNKVVIAPVQPVKIKSIGETAGTGQVGVKQHIIIQPISGNGIIDIVVFIRSCTNRLKPF